MPDPTPEALRGVAALVARGYAAGLDDVDGPSLRAAARACARLQDHRHALATAAALEAGSRSTALDALLLVAR
jgi:hypothetical protein